MMMMVMMIVMMMLMMVMMVWLLGTCGVGRSSISSADVLRDSRSSVLCSMRRRSSLSVPDAGDSRSVAMRAPSDAGSNSFGASEQDLVDILDDSSTAAAAQRDTAAAAAPATEDSRRGSAATATVDLNCSVVDTGSRNRYLKSHAAAAATRRKSLVEDYSTTDSRCAESYEQKRTKSYDMSAYEVTVL